MSVVSKSRKDHNIAEHQDIHKLSPSDLEYHYKMKARDAWDTAWNMLNMPSSNWKREAGTDLNTGVVFSQHFHTYGKVFMLEGYVDANLQMTFEETVLKIEQSLEWNPTLIESRTLQVVDDCTDISYNVSPEVAGGLVSSRDFVNLRHWETRDGITLSAGCAVFHPDMPPSKKYIRGENKSGGWVFKPVEGNPDRCIFGWIMNSDIKGWIPRIILEQAFSKTLLQFLHDLRKHMASVKKASAH